MYFSVTDNVFTMWKDYVNKSEHMKKKGRKWERECGRVYNGERRGGLKVERCGEEYSGRGTLMCVPSVCFRLHTCFLRARANSCVCTLPLAVTNIKCAGAGVRRLHVENTERGTRLQHVVGNNFVPIII